MYWIGLTGGLGSGKSTVAQFLRDLDLNVIDADEIARLVVRPGSSTLKEVVAKFGQNVLKTNGELNRQSLGAMVFANPLELRKLEAILHPAIRTEVQKIKQSLKNGGETVAFYDVPLLFEKNMEKDFSGIVVVNATDEERILRVKKRDGLDLQQIKNRMDQQVPLAEKVKKATWVIENSSDQEALMNAVRDYWLIIKRDLKIK